MRSFRWIVLILAAIGLLYVRNHEKIQKSNLTPASTSEVVSSLGLLNYFETSGSAVDDTDALDTKLESIAKIASKALLSKFEKDQLRMMLSDSELQIQVISSLSADDAQPFDIGREKRRMQATAFLNLVFQDSTIAGHDRVIRLAADRIMTVNFRSISDVKQKKSILGDVVEIMQSLKRHDPDTFQSLAESISESDKPLQHALKIAG